jgi:hypothetical protein
MHTRKCSQKWVPHEEPWSWWAESVCCSQGDSNLSFPSHISAKPRSDCRTKMGEDSGTLQSLRPHTLENAFLLSLHLVKALWVPFLLWRWVGCQSFEFSMLQRQTTQWRSQLEPDLRIPATVRRENAAPVCLSSQAETVWGTSLPKVSS